MTGRSEAAPETRSRIMRSIRSKNTGPELAVRRILTGMNIRYRLHPAKVPGRPDVALIGRKLAIFVHGCFWHQHSDPGCRLRKYPHSNLGYWAPKLRRNIERDAEHIASLMEVGWKTLVVWECEIADRKGLERRLKRFLK